ncbi:PPOX class F420-dependent oxidoreductase [Motilibacter deserti]|uniref:PPOX class F420-dependent oxidoreductase n=1 Tax=Motilibacter deserti TaxID=2714956 RepID=A0ABX0GWZ8_9ACTN|nr:PPOX class F420-dependent oxidoreductase [Motilibacter deserti]NHC15083.1 PPOX class F420-dependent oxidoreductase [Motilibacter deserti]
MAQTSNGPELLPTTVELARGANYAAMSTLLPSGAIQTQYVWVGTDGKRLLVNTEVHRAKFKNVEQDPRVTLCIRDEADPYHYAEVRGTVVERVTGPAARQNIDELSQKYTGKPYDEAAISSERVMVWIVPERQTIAG